MSVDDPINFTSSSHIENVPKTITKQIIPKTLTATYEWYENTASTIEPSNVIDLVCDRPLVSGYFLQTTNSTLIDIHTYEHNAILGSWIDIQFQNENMLSQRYKVVELVDSHTIKVEQNRDYGTIENYTYNNQNDTYNIALSTLIDKKIYDLNPTLLHIRYEIANNYAVTETTSNFELYKNASIVTGISINELSAEIFNTIYAPFPVGQISITPLVNISGNCTVVPMIQITGSNPGYLRSNVVSFGEN